MEKVLKDKVGDDIEITGTKYRVAYEGLSDQVNNLTIFAKNANTNFSMTFPEETWSFLKVNAGEFGTGRRQTVWECCLAKAGEWSWRHLEYNKLPDWKSVETSFTLMDKKAEVSKTFKEETGALGCRSVRSRYGENDDNYKATHACESFGVRRSRCFEESILDRLPDLPSTPTCYGTVTCHDDCLGYSVTFSNANTCTSVWSDGQACWRANATCE